MFKAKPEMQNKNSKFKIQNSKWKTRPAINNKRSEHSTKKLLTQ
jgi:hypothetical protein